MSHFVYDNGAVPGVKVDARPSRPPANKQFTAAEMNQITSALTDIQGAVNGTHPFHVKRYGALCDGTTDDAAAFQAALDAAYAFNQSTGLRPTVFWTDAARHSKPLFISPNVGLEGLGKYGSTLTPSSGFSGYNLICAENASAGRGPFHLGAFGVSGQYTYADPGNPVDPDNHYYDLAQSYYGKIPLNTSWTVSFYFKPSAVADSAIIWGIVGQLATNASEHAVRLIYNGPGAGFALYVRYGGQVFGANATFAADPGFSAGTEYHFEISYDHSAKAIRFFVNGQRWTNGSSGALSVLSGALAGAADGSGMCMYPWETNVIGPSQPSSALQDGIAAARVPGTLRQWHMSQIVRHTSAFTPGTQTRDGNTLMLINFDTFYRGCIVAQTGTSGAAYIYPWISGIIETSGVVLRNFGLVGGSGVLGVFASQMLVQDIFHLSPQDGWFFTRNGYFSRFRNVDIVGGTGRVGWANLAGSYCTIEGCTFAGPLCMVGSSANLFGGGTSISVQSVYYAGLVLLGPGIVDLTGISIDAEVNVTVPWLGALYIGDPSNSAITLRSPTLYGPTNKRTSDPIVRVVNSNDVASPSQIILENPYFAAPPSAAGMIQNYKPFGRGTTYWAHPIKLKNATYGNAPNPLTETVDYLGATTATPGNVIDETALQEFHNPRTGAAAPVAGTWAVGNIVYNTTPSAGGYLGWVCVAAGTPGTWKGFGVIQS